MELSHFNFLRTRYVAVLAALAVVADVAGHLAAPLCQGQRHSAQPGKATPQG